MFRRILVATDGSETARRGVAAAIALAAADRAELTALTVVDFYRAVADMQMADESLFEQHLRSMRRKATAIVDEVQQEARAAGVQAVPVLRQTRGGGPAQAIVEEARRGHDLLVVGSHGRRGWHRFLLGSDAEEVLRQAPIPVLVVRAPGGA